MFIISKSLLIINVSNPLTIKEICSMFFETDIENFADFWIAPNKRAAFGAYYFSGISYFMTIDLTNLNSPQMIGSLLLPNQEFWRYLTVLKDSQTVLVSIENRILVINTCNLKQPEISGLIAGKHTAWLQASTKDDSIYVGNVQGLKVYDMSIKNALYFTKTQFALGGYYSQSLVPMTLNNRGKYDILK